LQIQSKNHKRPKKEIKTMKTMVVEAYFRIAALVGQIPGGGAPAAPPGVDTKLNTLLSWGSYIGFGICVMGLIITGATLAVSHRRGESGQHAAGIGYALGGSILIGVASGLVKVFAA
jgi:hypothetical protein